MVYFRRTNRKSTNDVLFPKTEEGHVRKRMFISIQGSWKEQYFLWNCLYIVSLKSLLQLLVRLGLSCWNLNCTLGPHVEMDVLMFWSSKKNSLLCVWIPFWCIHSWIITRRGFPNRQSRQLPRGTWLVRVPSFRNLPGGARRVSPRLIITLSDIWREQNRFLFWP